MLPHPHPPMLSGRRPDLGVRCRVLLLVAVWGRASGYIICYVILRSSVSYVNVMLIRTRSMESQDATPPPAACTVLGRR